MRRLNTKTPFGLTFIELVFAIGLLFFAAGGVLSIIIAGAGYPAKNQQSTLRDSIARQMLDQQTNSGTTPGDTPMTVVPGYPDYQYQVSVLPAPYDAGDPNQAVIRVDVQGPLPNTAISTLRVGYAQTPGSVLYQQYGCVLCHALGAATPTGLAPNFSLSNSTINVGLENELYGTSLTVNQYIDQSVRQPNAYMVPGFSVLMTSYPSVMDMPQGDLNALRQFIYGQP